MYAPYNVLKAWIKEEDERDFVMFSVEYKNACLYALHPRKIDPYIEINPNWKKSLFFEHVDLMQYFQTKYIEYVQSLHHLVKASLYSTNDKSPHQPRADGGCGLYYIE